LAAFLRVRLSMRLFLFLLMFLLSCVLQQRLFVFVECAQLLPDHLPSEERPASSFDAE